MKKILPTTLFLFSLIAMLILWWLFPSARFLSFPAILLGLPLLVGGLWLSILGSNKFEEVQTEIKTFDDPDVLVTDGVFRYTRNPMYLGFVIALLGVALLFGSLPTFIVVAVYFVITDRWYIQYEEQAMARVFGEEYRQYKKRTRRWL